MQMHPRQYETVRAIAQHNVVYKARESLDGWMLVGSAVGQRHNFDPGDQSLHFA